MTDAPPSSHVDQAAVEAAENFWVDTTADLTRDDIDNLARIITDAYAESQDTEVAINRTVEHQDATITRLSARLTAEQKVREKLVAALKMLCDTEAHEISINMETTENDRVCDCRGCTALAAAEKLEKQDA